MEYSNEFLSELKNFLLNIHSQIMDQQAIVNPEHIQTIDRAVIQLRTNQQNLSDLQNQNANFTSSRAAMNDFKKQCQHLQKRLSRKTEQIQILKQTVKSLYADNQKIVRQKQQSTKQSIALKQQVGSLKKKIKRQEQQMSNHKNQLQKLSNIAQERLNQYMKEDQQKQMKIKKLQNQAEKMRNELTKKDKNVMVLSKKLDEFKRLEDQHASIVDMVQGLKYENSLLKNQLQSTKQRIHQQKLKYLQQNQCLLKQIEQNNSKLSSLSSQKQQFELKLQTETQKIQNYQQQIVMRTEKLKQKNKQIKVYNEQIQKLAKRVKQLSEMADQVISQNRELSEKCRNLQHKLEEFKVLYTHVGKLKGQISHKKSVEFARLIQSINKLQASL